jgi:hypothetical protein
MPKRDDQGFEEPYGKELLTASEVAKILRISPKRVTRMGQVGYLTPCWANGKIKYMGTQVAALNFRR